MFVAKVDDIGTGLLMVTEDRILFYKTGILPGINVRTVEIPLRDVSQIDISSGFAKGTLRINAGARRFDAEDVFKSAHLSAAAQYIRERACHAASGTLVQPAVSSKNVSTIDTAALLRELGSLKDAGILTEEEFHAKKTEILARM
jgi:hypothetical protein